MLTRNHLGERKVDFTLGVYSPSWGKLGQEPRIEAVGVEEHCSPDAVLVYNFSYTTQPRLPGVGGLGPPPSVINENASQMSP